MILKFFTNDLDKPFDSDMYYFKQLSISIENIGSGLATDMMFIRFDETSNIILKRDPNKSFFSQRNYLRPTEAMKVFLILPVRDMVYKNFSLVVSFRDIVGNHYHQTYRLDFSSNDGPPILTLKRTTSPMLKADKKDSYFVHTE